MESLSLMERFKDPDIFETLTAGEKMQGSLITTLMGMGLTFVVLVLLWGLIAIMAKVLYKDSPDTMTEVVPVQAASSGLVAATGSTVENVGADEQLIAVIMAAISVSEGSGFKSNLVIKRINRISGNTPTWGGAGQRDAIDSRRM